MEFMEFISSYFTIKSLFNVTLEIFSLTYLIKLLSYYDRKVQLCVSTSRKEFYYTHNLNAGGSCDVQSNVRPLIRGASWNGVHDRSSWNVNV